MRLQYFPSWVIMTLQNWKQIVEKTFARYHEWEIAYTLKLTRKLSHHQNYFPHKPTTSQPLEMKLSIKLNKLKDTCRIFGDTSTPYLVFWCYDWWN